MAKDQKIKRRNLFIPFLYHKTIYSIKLNPECIAKTCFQYSTSSGSGSGRRFNKQSNNILSCEQTDYILHFSILHFVFCILFDHRIGYWISSALYFALLSAVECPEIGRFRFYSFDLSASWAEMKRLFASALHKLSPIHCWTVLL